MLFLLYYNFTMEFGHNQTLIVIKILQQKHRHSGVSNKQVLGYLCRNYQQCALFIISVDYSNSCVTVVNLFNVTTDKNNIVVNV